MTDALERFIERIRSAWGPLSSPLVRAVRTELSELSCASPTEPWLAALLEEAPASKELYRDPTHGFMLLAHSEPAGLYRPPHDHGRSWVVYALQQGELEIGTYGRIEACAPSRGRREENGADRVRLVQRDVSPMRVGDARVYLPSDIHDTRCVRGPSLLFRFTERDLKREDQEARMVTRYVDRQGVWTVGPA
ncbi:MAG: hypothetical protein JWN48_25 [Myxococcaceae bacterium]|nr:hypothetical protein [Myxococcaceae bacterium]